MAKEIDITIAKEPQNDADSQSQLFHASPWLNGSAASLSDLFTEYPKITFSKGHVFYGQEENSGYVYLIQQGRICLSIDNVDGDAKDVFIADKGFIFGKLSAFDSYPNCCYAVVVSDEAVVTPIPKTVFLHQMETSTSFCYAIISMMSNTIRTLISQIRLLTFTSSRAKVSYALYHMLRQYSTPESGEYKINITFTHQEIGQLVGLSRVSVSNILSQMVKEGVLHKNNGYYFVSDMDAVYQTILKDLS